LLYSQFNFKTMLINKIAAKRSWFIRNELRR